MPSADKRNYNSKPATREVIDFHNRHGKETYPEVKARMPREPRAYRPRVEVYEED
jgi:hypothetical protein